MADYNYYQEQLKDICTDGQYPAQLKISSDTGTTNWLALNAESAKEIVQFLTVNYLKPKKVQPTEVIFRVYSDGSVIALFPYESGFRYGQCSSYMHVGQHSDASITGVYSDTKLATPEQYQDLHNELTNLGYTLKVLKKHSWHKYSKTYHYKYPQK